jgi:hypothetical protein
MQPLRDKYGRFVSMKDVGKKEIEPNKIIDIWFGEDDTVMVGNEKGGYTFKKAKGPKSETEDADAIAYVRSIWELIFILVLTIFVVVASVYLVVRI